MKKHTLFLASTALLAVASCTTSNTNFCDETEACDQNSGAPFCDLATKSCVELPEPNACNAAEPCTSASLPFCESMSNTCVECILSSDCTDGDVCSNNVCGPCTPGSEGDTLCSAADLLLPYCSPNGDCVACLESEQCDGAEAPVCDLSANECVACQRDADCASGACSVDSAECIDSTSILYVDGAAAVAADCGSIDKPCKTIMAAIPKVTTTNKTIVIAQGDYPEQVAIAGITVALVASGDVKINPNLAVDEESAVLLSGGADVELRRVNIAPVSGIALTNGVSCNASTVSLRELTLQDAGKRGLTTDSCSAFLDSVTVLNNSTAGSGAGLSCFQSSITIEQSIVSENANGGTTISDCDYIVRNSMFLNNGGTESDNGGVNISFGAMTPGTEVFEFNTVFGNQVRTTSARASGVHCLGASLVASSNIIVGGAGDNSPVVDAACSHVYSLLDEVVVGTGNITGDPLFVNELSFKLRSDSPCVDAAEPGSSVSQDIDGDMRPQGDAHDMGADEFVAN